MLGANPPGWAYPGEAALDPSTPDTSALATQSRRQALYRGSYSLNASAADQAGPGLEPAFATKSPPRPAYAAPRSLVVSSFTPNAAVVDAWASAVLSRTGPPPPGPRSLSIMAWDSSTNTFADWTPPPARSRQQPNYSAPRSQAISPSFTTILDAWAAVTFGRSVPFYSGSRAITISVFDPATNTFADWTPPALLSRATQSYSPPRSRGPLVSDQPAVISSTDFVAAALSRQQPYYRGSYSLNANAADQEGPGLEWTAVFAQRQQPFYTPGRSLATLATYFVPAPPSDPWAQVTQSRRLEFYRTARSVTFAAWDDHACTTLFPDSPLLFPDSPILFPDMCPQVEIGFVTQGRPVAFYLAPRSRALNVYAPFVAIPDTWAQVFSSRIPHGSVQRRSSVINVLGLDSTTISMAFVTQSRRMNWLERRSFVTLVLDGPSGIVPDVPALGGAGDFVVFRDPFRQNPFKDPFRDSPLVIKVPRGER